MTEAPRDRPKSALGRASHAKVAANQVNARRSTGPKTSDGKRTASRNALRHGLAVSVWADPSSSEQAEQLAHLIAGEGADPSRLALARRIAEAQIDLHRVRAARFRLLVSGIDDPDYRSEPAMWEILKLVAADVRSSRSVLRTNPLPVVMAPYIDRGQRREELLRPSGPDDRAAAVIAESAHQLARLERYEVRALSRRKKAIRDFDELQVDQS